MKATINGVMSINILSTCYIRTTFDSSIEYEYNSKKAKFISVTGRIGEDGGTTKRQEEITHNTRFKK